MRTSRLRQLAVLAALPLLGTMVASRASAAVLHVVTPGEQNTQSGENGCANAPCGMGHWLHYPEIIAAALGANYTVTNNGDGGAVLGCSLTDTATNQLAGGDSFCMGGKYAATITPTPDIVIIGTFGGHDQRILIKSMSNQTALYMESVFEAAYEGLVQRYMMKGVTKIYMMTPVDLPWTGLVGPLLGPLANTGDLVKDIMVPAAMAVATKHSLPVIDTYTAISATPTLAMSYLSPNKDGQVNAAGQQKMADLIVAAIKGGGAGGAGGGGTGGGGAGGAAGGTSGAGGAGTAGSGGTGGTTGAAGTTGTAGMTGAAGSTAAGGSTGTGTAGTTGASGSTGSTAGTTGTGAAGTTGAAGSTTSGGAAGTTTPPAVNRSSGGCAFAGVERRGWTTPLLLAIGLVALSLRRRRRARR
jgi:hypothetical protein